MIAVPDSHARLVERAAAARSAQRSLLPALAPVLPGLQVWGWSETCEETGGDFFDFIHTPDGLLVVVGDVAGHGMGAALQMASTRAAVRALAETERDLGQLVYRLNHLVGRDVRHGRFVTLFVGLFTHDGRLRHVGAGHVPPVLYRPRTGATRLLKSAGPPLGVGRGVRFAYGTDVALEPDDVLLFVTDGVTEARDARGDRYGYARLRRLLARRAGEGAPELVRTVFSRLAKYAAERRLGDDATVVAAKCRA